MDISIIYTKLNILCTMPVAAEPYKSKDFPPDDVLITAVKAGEASVRIVILGKVQEASHWEIYYTRTILSPDIGVSTLVRLDTDVWILTDFRGSLQILTKPAR